MSALSARRESLLPYEGYFGRPVHAVLADLEQFCLTFEKWQTMQNLVSRETVPDLWNRHVLDSLQLLPIMDTHIVDSGVATIVDIGSGGGFPALPIAIALKERPVHFHLIESRARKCAFLRAIIRDFGLSARVHTIRIEDASRAAIGPVHGITARALASFGDLMDYIAPLWSTQTRAYLHKGRDYGEELRQADSVWQFDMVKHVSKVDPQGVILEISGLERVV